MFDLVVRGGTLVRPDGLARAELGITGGVVAAVGAPGEALEGGREIDAAGRLILPGLVDAHAHIPGYILSTRLDDFPSATTAAAVGGVTTVMLMPTDDPRTATPVYFEKKRRIGEAQSFVDFAIQAMVSPKSERNEIEAMAALGAVSFELFLAYGGNPSFVVGNDDYELHRLMQIVGEVGGIVGVTPHSGSLIARLTQQQKELEQQRLPFDPLDQQDALAPVERFAVTRPVLSEALGIARACTVAVATATRTHLRALSSRESIAMVRRFRDAAPLSSEVMSHHLLFSDAEAVAFGPYGIIVPPIRAAAERDGLREAIRAGEIDMVVSDHSPVLRADKEAGWASIWRTPPGMPGLQTLCASLLALVDDGVLSLPDVARAGAEQPARRFGLFPRKGALQIGSDADFIVVDPSRPTLIADGDQRSKADYTTLKGRTISSWIESVFLRGNRIAHDGEIATGPSGRFVRP